MESDAVRPLGRRLMIMMNLLVTLQQCYGGCHVHAQSFGCERPALPAWPFKPCAEVLLFLKSPNSQK